MNYNYGIPFLLLCPNILIFMRSFSWHYPAIEFYQLLFFFFLPTSSYGFLKLEPQEHIFFLLTDYGF